MEAGKANHFYDRDHQAMKNIPILGKFGAILAVFGVFSIAVALYSPTQMRTLNTGYLAMRAGPTDALLELVRSNIDIQYMREDATVAITSKNPAATQKALASVKTDATRFAQFMDLGATDDPAEADAIQSVKSQFLQLSASICTNPSALAASAGTGPNAPSVQDLNRTQCTPQFIAVTNAIQPIIDRLRSQESAAVETPKSTTNSTIAFPLYTIIAGTAAVMIGAFFAIRAWVIAPVNM